MGVNKHIREQDMEIDKRIEVCAYCSGFDVKELKGKVKVKTGCIGKCSKKCPELAGKVYGFLNGEFIVCDTKEEFFAKMDELDSYEASSNRNPLVDAFLEHVEKWREEFESLRRIVLDCELTEELKWGQPCYMFQNNNLIILGGFKEYIALSFFKGALLKDTKAILTRQTENVQAGRQLRFTSVEEIDQMEDIIKAYIYEAIEIEKAGLKVITEKKPELQVPEELQNKFEEDPAFKDAFYALTPGRQKGYLYHFLQPKQSKTRENRIEKYRQQIFDGKGLND